MRTEKRTGNFQWISIGLIVLTVFIIILMGFVVSARAEYSFNPQYHNQGTIGTEDRTWGDGWFKNFHITSALTQRYTIVNHYNQFSALSGASPAVSGMSVFNVPTVGGMYLFDVSAIVASCQPSTGMTAFKNSMTVATGVTVVPKVPTADDKGTLLALYKIDSSVTPIHLWVPQEKGVTPYCTLMRSDYDAGTSLWRVSAAAGTTPYDVPAVRQMEGRTYIMTPESGVSIWAIDITQYGPAN